MKYLSRIALVFAAIVLFSVAASAQINQFIGNFNNENSSTGGITRLVVTNSGGGNVRVHAWGQCSPSDCDWGTVDGYAYSPSVTSNPTTSARAVSAAFHTSFSDTLVIIRPVSALRVRVEMYTRFTDGSGRSNYTLTETFRKQLIIIPKP